jgi:hypothetical protein
MTGPFVAPDDPEYLALKSEYSFNDQALRQQFLSVSNQINVDNSMLAKQLNLAVFRISCDPSVPIPRVLFGYLATQQNQTQDMQALKSVISWTKKAAPYDLATEIAKVYPRVPWITDYFVISTFPATFGHFLSEEYLQYGLSFIQSHLNDPLAPRLIGTYLMHSFLFRDRLMLSFFQLIVRNEGTEMSIVEVFVEAVRSSIRYLTEFHLEAIRILRGENQARAIEAVFTYFLIPTIEIWAFSPLYRTTNLIQKKGGPATNYQTIVYDFVLREEVVKLRDDEARASQFLDLFVDDLFMEMPKISAIVVYGGVKFPMTVVDITIIQHLSDLHRSLSGSVPRTRDPQGNVETALADAMIIRTNFSHYLPSSINEPVATETSPHLTRKRLQEHKAMHDFLFRIAGGLKQFHTNIAAVKNVSNLYYRVLAHRLFLADGCSTQPAQYASFQRMKYAAHIFNQFASPAFREYVKTQRRGESGELHERDLLRRINQGIKNGQSVAQSIVSGTVDCINEWKARYNAAHPSSPQGLCQEMKEDLPHCQFFVDAADRVTFSLVMNQLSNCPYPILGRSRESPKANREALTANLAHASETSPFITCTKDQVARDSAVKASLDTDVDVSFLLMKAEDAAEAAFDAEDHRFGIGDWAVFFLEVELLLRSIFKSDRAIQAIRQNPGWERLLMCALFDGKEPIFLRGWLFQILMLVKLLREMKSPFLDDLEEIGNPINDAVVAAFANLRQWFGFKKELFASR